MIAKSQVLILFLLDTTRASLDGLQAFWITFRGLFLEPVDNLADKAIADLRLPRTHRVTAIVYTPD